MKKILIFAAAMMMSSPVFAQDIEDIYKNDGAIAANSVVSTADQNLYATAQQLTANRGDDQVATAPTGDTGPYIDDNPYF
ncbi:hypothetical protein [Telmatospirillum sp.]|uniref:hypothetical protein n=1 Tax=Telmatospirillum sp. TaxID=2079197 RepID=UPI002847A60C|nr:hypothetical protein [Telmatospirillum sp.]MDR3440609.1 hypothetical protein [Telmatospirillum sp.]